MLLVECSVLAVCSCSAAALLCTCTDANLFKYATNVGTIQTLRSSFSYLHMLQQHKAKQHVFDTATCMKLEQNVFTRLAPFADLQRYFRQLEPNQQALLPDNSAVPQCNYTGYRHIDPALFEPADLQQMRMLHKWLHIDDLELELEDQVKLFDCMTVVAASECGSLKPTSPTFAQQPAAISLAPLEAPSPNPVPAPVSTPTKHTATTQRTNSSAAASPVPRSSLSNLSTPSQRAPRFATSAISTTPPSFHSAQSTSVRPTSSSFFRAAQDCRAALSRS